MPESPEIRSIFVHPGGWTSRAGRILHGFKREIDIPISAILILNTVAHTVGAAVAGATYQQVFEPGTLWIDTRESNAVWIHRRSPRLYDGFDVLVRAPPSGPV
jgi:hypothetical protein